MATTDKRFTEEKVMGSRNEQFLAEHLLDYMVEPQRSAASVLMQRHGMA